MTHQDQRTSTEAERRALRLRRERELDEALDQSFPASDPPAMIARARARPHPRPRRPS
jgi:hypothetical protein